MSELNCLSLTNFRIIDGEPKVMGLKDFLEVTFLRSSACLHVADLFLQMQAFLCTISQILNTFRPYMMIAYSHWSMFRICVSEVVCDEPCVYYVAGSGFYLILIA